MAVHYRPAPSVQRIIDNLIPKHHDRLEGVRVEAVFRDKAQKSGGTTVLGRAKKVSGLGAYLAQKFEPDEVPDEEEDLTFFLIEIAEDIWAMLDEHQRTALVDHELSHCGVDWDDDKVKLFMVPHDLEEFGGVVERYGLWRPDVAAFADSMAKGVQLEFGSVDE